MQLPPIATTTVGSFPRPTWLGSVPDRSEVSFRLEGDMLKEAQDDATRLVMQTQERIGIDLLTDGEQRRSHFINHILAAFEGIDLKNLAVKQVYRRREKPHSVPRQGSNGPAHQDGRARTYDGYRQHGRRSLQR
jgi:5-methyltetrahydropteroyltriglutamate--homocysteine methyltransferase